MSVQAVKPKAAPMKIIDNSVNVVFWDIAYMVGENDCFNPFSWNKSHNI